MRVLKVKCEEKREKKTFEKPKNTPKEETLIRESKKAYHAGAIDDHNTPLSSSSFLSLLFSLFESLSLCVREREREREPFSSCRRVFKVFRKDVFEVWGASLSLSRFGEKQKKKEMQKRHKKKTHVTLSLSKHRDAEKRERDTRAATRWRIYR